MREKDKGLISFMKYNIKIFYKLFTLHQGHIRMEEREGVGD